MNRTVWETDHRQIQRVIGRRWRRLKRYDADRVDALLAMEDHLYYLAGKARQEQRRLFPKGGDA